MPHNPVVEILEPDEVDGCGPHLERRRLVQPESKDLNLRLRTRITDLFAARDLRRIARILEMRERSVAGALSVTPPTGLRV